MKTFQERAYQAELERNLRDALRSGNRLVGDLRSRRVILQMETGGGKTVVVCRIIKMAYEKGSRCLFLARGRELVFQCSATLDAMDVPHGVIMRGKGFREATVQVASKDTFYSWVVKRGMEPPPADLIVIDEAHGSVSPSWLKILDLYKDAFVIGPTATPARADGKGLGAVYGGMVQAVPTSYLIANDYLVGTRVFAPYRPDMKGCKLDHNGDYDADAAAARIDKPTLVGDVVKHWKELSAGPGWPKGRPTVVYACNIQHSLHLCDQFTKAGVKAVHVDGSTEAAVRDEIANELESGYVQVVCNVGVYCQGVDIPCLAVACLVRPTRSLGLFRQMCGRIKRVYGAGGHKKTECVLIDHSGSVFFHGHPDRDIQWSLDEDSKIEKLDAAKRDAAGEREPFHCPQCHAVWVSGPVCPSCGHKVQRKSKGMEHKDGKLVEVDAPREKTLQDRQKYWIHCLAVMFHRGRTAEAAACMYKREMKEWPGEGKSAGLTKLPPAGRWRVPVANLFPEFGRKK